MVSRRVVDWDKIHDVIRSIPIGYWMSYGDVCEAAGLKRSSAMAVGIRLAKAEYVPETIYRVLRADGTLSAGWKGEIGTSEDCMAKLREEGVTFNQSGAARQCHRHYKK